MLTSLSEICDALNRSGYQSELRDDVVTVRVGEFPATITLNDAGEAVVNCQIATLGDVAEENLATFAFAALNANTHLRPYAIALIADGGSGNEAGYPVVLTDAIPLGDFSEGELQRSMQSLLKAIVGSRSVLEAGIQQAQLV